MTEQLISIGVGLIGLITVMWRGMIFIQREGARRNETLTNQLIAANKKEQDSKIEALTLRLEQATKSIDELREKASALRVDLDTEKALREKEQTRATEAETREATLAREKERQDVIISTFERVIGLLNVSLPSETLNITFDEKPTTDDVTAAAAAVTAALNNNHEPGESTQPTPETNEPNKEKNNDGN